MIDAYSLEPWQVPGYLDARDGRLHMGGVDLVALAEARGTPLVVYSEARIRRNARAIREAFSAAGARTMVCYAAKAFAHLEVLRLVRDEGLGVEVNSGGELAKARQTGVPDDRIVFNGVAKTEAEFAQAMAPPIKAINVDSLFELTRLAAVADAHGLTANVALRFAPGLAGGTMPGNDTGAETGKFGLLASELPEALALFRRGTDRLRLAGLHVHVGSQVTDAGVYAEVARFALALVAQAEARLKRPLDHVNLGGGYPLNYVKSPNTASYLAPNLGVSVIAATLAKALAARPDLELVVEPGRAVVGDAAVLLARVENHKRRGEVPWLTLDAGYNVIIESFSYKWYFHALTANRAEDREVGRFRLAGPLCDSGDAFHDVDGEGLVASLLASEPALRTHRTHQGLLRRTLVRLPAYRELPRATTPGDLVAFRDVGAYSVETMSANNGRPRPEVVMLSPEGAVSTLRRRETYADLIAEDEPA
ncbi:MAG: diaminopimelate decarboxylase [Alphaproteobacteria bacterium]